MGKLTKAQILAADPSTLNKSDLKKLENWKKKEKEKELAKSEEIQKAKEKRKEKFDEIIGEGDPSGASLMAEKTKKTDVEVLKDIRVSIDETYQFAEEHFPGFNPCLNSLFYGKSWLGKALGELNEKNPYKVDKVIVNPKDIPPTADVAEGISKLVYDFMLKGELERIQYLRTKIQDITDYLLRSHFKCDTELFELSLKNSYSHLSEAKFHLGKELARIRNNSL